MLKLVLKLLFKASMPLIMLVGVMSYGLYMRGGDPGALLGSVAGGALDRVADVARGATRSANKQATRSLDALTPGADQHASDEFYTWVDADGITHYSSEPPANVSTSTVTVNSDTNLIRSVPVQVPEEPPVTGSATTASRGQSSQNATSAQVAAELGSVDGRLPGMAGVQLPGGLDAKAITRIMQGAPQ